MTISPLNHLTPAEKRVVILLLEGLENRAIAHRLVISHRTVECHISRALSKSGCRNRLELALWLMNCSGSPKNHRACAGKMDALPA